MRGNIALVSLLTAGLLVGGQSGQPDPARRPRTLPEELDGGVIVDLADGDRFKASVSRDQRTVWGSRYDAATRSWSARAVVFKEKDVFCGDVDARAAGTAVALIAQCDEGGYSEDTGAHPLAGALLPRHADLEAFTLPGEAYEEPGISPSGSHAIWPLHNGWVDVRPPPASRSSSASCRGRSTPSPAPSPTPATSPCCTAARSVDGRRLRAQRADRARRPAPRPGSSFDARQRLRGRRPGQRRRHHGALRRARQPRVAQTTISRPDTASPWAVTGIAPSTAPGLVRHRGAAPPPPCSSTSPGLPLLAVGSPDKRRFYAQAYDRGRPSAGRQPRRRSAGASRGAPGATTSSTSRSVSSRSG